MAGYTSVPINAGHGHVRPRPDGAKARCGGPALCRVCQRETAALYPDCHPATCPNGKCVATGECIDKPRRRLIAFTGLAGSGKSTAALHLVDAHGFKRVRFAGPLKAMMAALGLSADEIDGHLKEIPCDLLGGKTPRHAMQTIGTEWGRDLIDSDLWIRAWRAALPATGRVVVDDCRFVNEAAAVSSAGGLIVHIDRNGAGISAAGHSSEGQPLPVDVVIQNDESIDALYAKINKLI